jgi:hypothetical protein
MNYTPQPRPRPVKAVLDEQRRAAEHGRAQAAAPAKPATDVVPAMKPPPPAMPDNRTPAQRYLDEIAPASMVGRKIRGSKDAVFVTPDDGETVPDDIDFVALCDQIMVGRIRFNGEGNPPDYRMGLLYDGFVPPRDEELPDRDQSQWQLGLDGQPSDPWAHFIYVVLQRGDTGELFTYTTSSKTGRRAIGNLLRHYDRLQKTHPDMYPIVRLKAGGFNHRDPRVGWVPVPAFAVVGRHPKDNAAKPDGSLAADLNDAVPF